MGHNRAGVRLRAKLKRHKNEMQRLAKKAEAAAESPTEGVLSKMKHVAEDAASKVTNLVKAAADKITQKKHD